MNLKRLVRMPLIALSLTFIVPAPNAMAAEITGIGIQMFDLQGTSLYARYCLQGSATVRFQAPINTTSTITDSSGNVFSSKTSQWGSGASSAPGDCSSFNYAYDEIKSGFIPGSTYTLTVNSEIEGATYSVTKSFTISGGSSAGTESFTNAPAVGGFAVVHPDGHVCGVIVGSIEYFGGNNRTMTSEYMGCPIGARIILQTTQSASGNVAGYSGSGTDGAGTVTYNQATNTFTVVNPVSTTVTLQIKDGVATDSSGKSFNTGTGVTTETTLTKTQYADFVGESKRIDSAKNEQLKALNMSKELALQTPGVERCVAWQGYLENGTECSKAIISTIASGETSTVTSSSVKNTITESSKNVLKTDTSTAGIDSVTVTVKAKNEFETSVMKIEAVEFEGKPKEIVLVAQKLETSTVVVQAIKKAFLKFDAIKTQTNAKSVALPDARYVAEETISETPKVCKIDGVTVVRLKKGTCNISYTLTSLENSNVYTANKSITFKK
jgi:hypothetical protein